MKVNEWHHFFGEINQERPDKMTTNPSLSSWPITPMVKELKVAQNSEMEKLKKEKEKEKKTVFLGYLVT